MPRAKGEFSVATFFPDGTSLYVVRFVSAVAAMNMANIFIKGSAAREGRIKRIVVTNGDDQTNFEWQHGHGVTFKREAA